MFIPFHINKIHIHKILASQGELKLFSNLNKLMQLAPRSRNRILPTSQKNLCWSHPQNTCSKSNHSHFLHHREVSSVFSLHINRVIKYIFFCVWHFTQHYVCKTYPHCCMLLKFFPSHCWIVIQYVVLLCDLPQCDLPILLL